MSSQSSGFINTQMRYLFLKRSTSDFKLISKEYPIYKFLITEANHDLDLPIVKKSENFILYKLN